MNKSTKGSINLLMKSFLGGKEPVNEKSFDMGSLFGLNPGDKRPHNIGHSTDWLKEFSDNPRLAGLNKIVSDNGVSEFGIYQATEGGEKRVIGHPLEEEIRTHTVPMFFSLWTAYRLMTGIVYIAYDLENGEPRNFKVFTVTHLTSAEEGSYTFQLGDKTLTYPEEQVIVDYDLALESPYTDGRGRAASIAEEIELDSWILRYMKTFYHNSAVPSMFIIPKGDQGPSSSDLERLVEALNSKHKGLGNAHRTAVLTFDAAIESVPNNHREMELLDSRRAIRDSALQHFGIPPEIMGIVENSNKATVVAAEHIYAKQVRMPILHHFEDIINSKILPRYKTSQEYQFRFDNILPDDEEMNLSKAKEGREGKTLTINEHRQLLGFPPLEGDSGKVLVGESSGEGDTSTVVEVDSGTVPVEVIDYKKVEEAAYAEWISNGKIKDINTQIEIIKEDKDE